MLLEAFLASAVLLYQGEAQEERGSDVGFSVPESVVRTCCAL